MRYSDGNVVRPYDIVRGKPDNTRFSVTGVVTRIKRGALASNLWVAFAGVEDQLGDKRAALVGDIGTASEFELVERG